MTPQARAAEALLEAVKLRFHAASHGRTHRHRAPGPARAAS